ncbi:uncharacterized protein ARMOST_17595 [Armillaria ostoyae]|uniref:Uncharacterized protein n=1 Tax=Armillaria ostoyae TaxID=47428 RepID=A0A284RZJ2_ARMOS|nr:uncharacterized protein ARMOST_17595 [Armillaria ostoyae]
MSHLSPTSPGLGASDAESPSYANALANPLVVEHVPPEIRHLVCENCWRSVFSAEFFQIAWKPRPENDYSNPSFFSCETPTWRQMQRQRRQHWIKFRHQCQWCKLVCRFIKRCHLVFENVRQPPKNKKYHLDVGFSQDRWNIVELSLFVEDGWSCAFRIHTTEGIVEDSAYPTSILFISRPLFILTIFRLYLLSLDLITTASAPLRTSAVHYFFV